MRRLIELIDNLDSHLAAIALAGTILLLSLQVFLRYVLSTAFAWNEEVSRFLYIWAVYLGMSMGVKTNEHVRVVVHLKFLFPRSYHKILRFADLLWLAFSVLLLWESIKFIGSMFQYRYISPSLGISMVWVYMIIPILFILMMIRLIQVHYKRFLKKERAEEVEPDQQVPGL